MSVLPTSLGAVLLGACLRDPGDIPLGEEGRSFTTRPSSPRPCPECRSRGWVAVADPFEGGYIDVRCPACGGT